MAQVITGAISGAVTGFQVGGPWGAVIGAVVGAGLGLVQKKAEDKRIEEQKKQQQRILDERKKQNALQNAQADIARNRNIRRAIAEARVRKAELEAQATGTGAVVGQSIIGDTASAIGAAGTQRAAQFGISQSKDRESVAFFDLQNVGTNRFDKIAAVGGVAAQGFAAFQGGAFEGLFDGFGGSTTASASTFTDIGGGAAAGGR